MADSVINICNRALSQIAETQSIQSISPPDANSIAATQCALWYDTMRQRLLRAAPWGFARTQLTMTQIGDLYPDGTSPFPFLWAYAYPSDCIKMRYVLPQPLPNQNSGADPPLTGAAFIGPTLRPSRRNRFLVQSLPSPNAATPNAEGATQRAVVTNVLNAIGVYTQDVTNPDQFDQLFTGALEASLSYKLCIPLSGNVAMQKGFQEAAEAALLTARTVDGNEAIPSSDVRVDWIEARGRGGGQPWAGLGSVYGADPPYSSWGSWYDGWENMNWGM